MTDATLLDKWAGWAPYFKAILRMVGGTLFITSGTTKLFAFPPAPGGGGETVPVMSQMWIGAILELVGGTLLLIGLFARPAAFILSGMMAVAYFQFHAPGGFWPTANGGMGAVIFCFLWLWFSAAGAGPWSVDAQRHRA